MKIALVSPYDYVHPGGVNNHIWNLAAEFRKLNHQVAIVAPVARDQQVPAGVVPVTRSITTIPSGGSNARVSLSLLASARIKELLEEERYDVVHLHNPFTPTVSMSFLYHRDAAPRTVMVATFHEYRDDINPLYSIAGSILEQLVERLDGRIAVSPVAREYQNTFFPGTYTVIPNGIDFQFFAGNHVRPLQRYDNGRPTVLFVGRLEHRKGFKYLLHAWSWVRAVVPNARLLVVGAFKNDDKEPFLTYAREQGIHGIRFVGPVSAAELPRYYHAADVFCAPSVGFESFGIVLLEAMAAGVPVVASDIPGYRMVLDHDVQGLLVEPHDPLALAKGILDLLDDAELRTRLGRAGRAKAAAYDWSRIAVQVLDFYSELVEKVQGG